MEERRSYNSRSRDREKEKEKDTEWKVVRKKACRYCSEPQLKLDYKDAKALKSFMTEREKILPRRHTGLCAFHQRQLTNGIKRARILGIIPFASSQRSV